MKDVIKISFLYFHKVSGGEKWGGVGGNFIDSDFFVLAKSVRKFFTDLFFGKVSGMVKVAQIATFWE